MCRLVVFMGTCPRCAGEFTWEELSQELSCLDAKNVGRFGECRRGVNYEYHTFDQDCPACSEELNEDEGVDVFEQPVVDQATQGYPSPSSRGGHQHHHHQQHQQSSSLFSPSSTTNAAKGKGKSKTGGHDDDGGRRKKKQRTT